MAGKEQKPENGPKTGESWVCQKFKRVCGAGKTGAEMRAEIGAQTEQKPHAAAATVVRATDRTAQELAKLDL